MLRELGDPVVRVVRVEHPAAKPHLFEWNAKARAVVFDLRARGAETPGWVLDHAAVVDHSVPVPARIVVIVRQSTGMAPSGVSSRPASATST